MSDKPKLLIPPTPSPSLQGKESALSICKDGSTNSDLRKESYTECLLAGLIALPASFCPCTSSMDLQHSTQSGPHGHSPVLSGGPPRPCLDSTSLTPSSIWLCFSQPFFVILVSSGFLSSSSHICFLYLANLYSNIPDPLYHSVLFLLAQIHMQTYYINHS